MEWLEKVFWVLMWNLCWQWKHGALEKIWKRFVDGRWKTCFRFERFGYSVALAWVEIFLTRCWKLSLFAVIFHPIPFLSNPKRLKDVLTQQQNFRLCTKNQPSCNQSLNSRSIKSSWRRSKTSHRHFNNWNRLIWIMEIFMNAVELRLMIIFRCFNTQKRSHAWHFKKSVKFFCILSAAFFSFVFAAG